MTSSTDGVPTPGMASEAPGIVSRLRDEAEMWEQQAQTHVRSILELQELDRSNYAARAAELRVEASLIEDLVGALEEARAGFASIRDDRNFTSAKCRAEVELARIDQALARCGSGE